MRILEALGLLDDCVYLCEEKSIDTPQVREALDVVHSYVARCRPQLEEFRNVLQPQGSGQQQKLIACFPAIHHEVRSKLAARIKTLEFRDEVKRSEKTKAEIARLRLELEGLPEVWQFTPW
jgi:hypothetical protein